MKTFKINLLMMALFALTLGMTSCGGNSEHKSHEDMENHEADHDHEAGDMEDHTYSCPMHPKVTGKEGDKCSKCGMGLKMAGMSHDSDNNQEAEQKGKEYTAAYVCPMHCEGSGSDEPGKCPVCGMDYTKNEDHKADGHDDEDSHEGHNH